MSRLSLPHGAGLPLELRKELSQLDLRLRWVSLVKGAGSLLVVLMLLAGLFLAVDFYVPLPGWVRFGFLAVLSATGLGLCYRWVVLPLVRKRRWPELAYLIDRSFPELQERVSSTVELAMLPAEQQGLASEFMKQRLRQETDRRLAKVDLWDCLSLSSMAVALAAGLVTAVLAAAPFLFYSGGYGLLWQRLLTPWQNLDSAANLTFVVEQGDRTVPRGDDFAILARPQWRYAEGTPPRQIRLQWTDQRGQATSREMSFDARLGAYVGKIPQVVSPLTYSLSSRGAQSRRYRVDVADRPRLVDVRLEIVPPAYTQHQPTVHEGAVGTMRAIQGSRLKATLTFEYPIASAQWNWSTSRVSRGTIDARAQARAEQAIQTGKSAASETAASGNAPSDERPTEIQGVVSAHGRSVQMETFADQSDTFTFSALSSAGLTNTDEPQRMIQVIPDRAPRIEISGSQEPQKVRPDEIVPIQLLADDDFGVTELQIVVEHLTAGKENPIIHTWTSTKTGPGVRRVDDVFELHLAPLALKQGDILGFRAVARDARPDPRPNEVWTTRRVLLINQDVKSLAGQDVEEYYDQVRRQAEMAKQEVVSHRKQVEQQRSQLDPKPREESKAALESHKPEWLQKKLSLKLQLDDLSRKLGQRPITQALDQMNVQPAREKIEQSAQVLEKFQASDKRDPLEMIREDEAGLREAENYLNRLINQLRDAERIEQELTQLERLARRARNLAQQAEQMVPEQSRPQSADAAKNSSPPGAAGPAEHQPSTVKAEQPAEAAIDQLQQEYSALAHDLDQLLSRRPELKQAAKNALLSELADASQLAEALAREQADMTSALQDQQAEAQARQQEVAAQLQEARELAEQLAARSEQAARQNAAPVFNAAPTAESAAQQEQANLGRAAEALQQARAALERFEQGQAEAAALPRDAQQAATQMAGELKQLAEQTKALHQQQREFDKQARTAKEQAQKTKQPIPEQTQQQLQEQAAKNAKQQTEIQEKLAGTMQAAANLPLPPQQQWARKDAVNQLEQAADDLSRKSSDYAADRMKDAAKNLDNLAKSLGNAESRAEKIQPQLTQLAQQARELAEQMQQTAAEGTAVVNEQAEQLANKQQEQLRQLLRQDTLDQEQKLADAVKTGLQAQQQAREKQLEQAGKTQQEFAEKIAALQEAVQQAAKDSIREPAPARQNPGPQQAAWQDIPLSPEMQRERFPNPEEKRLDQTADVAEKLAEVQAEQQKLNQQVAQVTQELSAPKQAEQLRNRLRELGEQQRQLAERTEKINSPVAALPRMQAQQAQREAAEALQQGQAEQVQQAQQQATRQLNQTQQQLTPPPQPADKAAAETTELAQALDQKLQQLENELAQARGHMTDPGVSQADMQPDQHADKQTGKQPETPSETQAASQANPAPSQGSEKSAPAATDQAAQVAAGEKHAEQNGDLLARLQALRESQTRLAEQAERLAQQSQVLAPDRKDLQQNLQQAAQQAQAASRQLQSGQMNKAAQQAEQAQQQLTAAAQQPGVNAQAQAAAEQLAEQQQQLAAQMQQLAENPQAGPLASQARQAEINQQAATLTETLQELSEQSRAKPIDDRHNSDQLQQLKNQSLHTNQALDQTLQQNQQGNARESAQRSAEAAQQLQKLAEQSARLADMKRETLVPEPVGAEAAEASRMLQQAQNSLQQAQQQMQQQAQAGESQTEPAGSAEAGQAAENGTPSSQPASNQPGSEPANDAAGNGDPTPPNSPLQQLAQDLAQASRALQQAHQKLQPQQQSSSQMSQQSQQPSESGQPTDSGDSTSGSQALLPGDGPMSGQILRSALMRDWGQRQEALEADLTDARRRTIDQDYSPLIQRYFEALAKPQNQQP